MPPRVHGTISAAPSPPGPAWQAAIDFGLDMSLVEENLALTPAERLGLLAEMQKTFEAFHPDHRSPPD